MAKVLQKGRKPIPVNWVFKTKLEANGMERLKSRIVTKGYLQVPGVDFAKRFSPVANNTSTRILIRIVRIEGGQSSQSFGHLVKFNFEGRCSIKIK